MSSVLKFDKTITFIKLIDKEVQCLHGVEDLSHRVVLIDEVLIVLLMSRFKVTVTT